MSLLKLVRLIQAKGFTDEVKSKFTKDELRAVRIVLDEVQEYGYSDTLNALWQQDFERQPVSIDEFLDDEYYLGKIGRSIYPIWRQELRKVLDPTSMINEWIITGSIGAGKTYVADAALLYKIYYTICLRNPQQFYGLGDGSPIVFGLFNIYKYLASATSFRYLVTWLRDMSPFFRSLRVNNALREGRTETDRQVLDFPKGVTIALGSDAINVLGQNLLGGLLDEVEFGRNKSVTSDEISQIADLYNNAKARMDSRFMQRGGTNPGLLCLVSSARADDGFIGTHVGKALSGDSGSTTHVSSFALYEVKEHVYRDSERFTVVVGDKLHRSYILEDEEVPTTPREGAKLVRVPVEFLDRFRHDIDTAIRDIAGVTTYGKSLFLPRRDVLLQCIDQSTKRKHPFSKEEVTLSLDDDDLNIEDYFIRDEILRQYDKSNNLWRPKYHSFADRYLHVDLAKNRDAAGLAMVTVSETKLIERFNNEGLKVNAVDYVFFVDLMLRIRAARGSEIDFSKIRRFIFFLMRNCGFRIKWVGYDAFQSTDSLQTFKKEKGLEAKEVSVDRKPGPYRMVKSIIMENRLDLYPYNPFFDEITKLEDRSLEADKVKGPVIDHPAGGSKDVSDAVTGAIFGALSTRGVTISGTDAEAISQRAALYQKINQEKADPIQNADWLRSRERGNPLESLFDD